MSKVLESIKKQMDEPLDSDTITENPENGFSADDLFTINAMRHGILIEGNEDLARRYIRKMIKQENILSVNDGRWDRDDLAEFCIYLFDKYEIIPIVFDGRVGFCFWPELLSSLAIKFNCLPSGGELENASVLKEHLIKEYKNQKQK